MAERFTRVDPIWYRYAQSTPITVGSQTTDLSFIQWVDEDVSLFNLQRARQLCGNAADEARMISDVSYPIGTRLRDIDECVKNGFIAMNQELWAHPAFVSNWRRFLSGGDVTNVINSRGFNERVQSPTWIAGTPVENYNSDLNSDQDTICPNGRFVSSMPDTTGWCDSFGDGRVVRKRGYGRNWTRGIRRGEWAQRLVSMYRQYATEDADRNTRKLAMFTPSPWFWFRSMGAAEETMTPWANGTGPTHVHNLDGSIYWRKNVGTDVYDTPVSAQWSYYHEWPTITSIVAIAPPAVWWLEFYRAFLDQVLAQSILDNITTIRKYVFDRNNAIASANFTTPAGLSQDSYREFIEASARETAPDPTTQTVAGVLQGAGSGAGAILGSMVRLSSAIPVAGAAIAAATMITGSIISMVDKITLKDDQADDEFSDEMGRIKPVVLPNALWFRTDMDVVSQTASIPSNINTMLPVPGWIRPSELEFYRGKVMLDMNRLTVPSGFARTQKPARDSMQISGITVTYPVGNATVQGRVRATAEEQAYSDQAASWLQNRFATTPGVLEQIRRGQRGQIDSIAPIVQRQQDIEDGKTPPTPSQPVAPYTAPVCGVTPPETFATQSEKDAWLAANPTCATVAAAIPVQIPWWWWALGGTAVVTVVGGGALVMYGRAKRKRRASNGANASEWDYYEFNEPQGWRSK